MWFTPQGSKKLARLLVCLALLPLAGLSVHSNADTIIWQVKHWPPYMMLHGDDVGQGRSDALLRLHQKHLPQYQHKVREMDWKRLWHDIRAGKSVCTIMAYKTPEREEYAVFSQANGFLLPNRLTIRRATWQALGEPTSYSLASILKNPQLRGALEMNRSYAQGLDRVLAKHEANGRVQRYFSSSSQFLEMLSLGRIDYYLEFPIAVAYQLAQSSTKSEIVTLPLDETEQAKFGYTACPKTPWGQKTIQAIDSALTKIKPTDEYRQALDKWSISEASDHEREDFYNKVFLYQ